MTLHSIGSFEAKTHLAHLLERAMQGEEIVITRRGKPVAKLGPVQASDTDVSPQAVVKQLRALSRQIKLSKDFWEAEGRQFKDQGRR